MSFWFPLSRLSLSCDLAIFQSLLSSLTSAGLVDGGGFGSLGYKSI